jgi:hypothetical protein
VSTADEQGRAVTSPSAAPWVPTLADIATQVAREATARAAAPRTNVRDANVRASRTARTARESAALSEQVADQARLTDTDLHALAARHACEERARARLASSPERARGERQARLAPARRAPTPACQHRGPLASSATHSGSMGPKVNARTNEARRMGAWLEVAASHVVQAQVRLDNAHASGSRADRRAARAALHNAARLEALGQHTR